jgi:hypothetical protein
MTNRLSEEKYRMSFIFSKKHILYLKEQQALVFIYILLLLIRSYRRPSL